MTDLCIIFDNDAPTRRAAGDLFPWSAISDAGEVFVAGKRRLFDVSRIYDKREPQGERVQWVVALYQPWGKGLRTIHQVPTDIEKAILAQFKDRIEADNAKSEAAFEVESGLEEPRAPVEDRIVTMIETSGATWRCSKTYNGKGDRSYWVSFAHGERSAAKPGIVGFYAASIEHAKGQLGIVVKAPEADPISTRNASLARYQESRNALSAPQVDDGVDHARIARLDDYRLAECVNWGERNSPHSAETKALVAEQDRRKALPVELDPVATLPDYAVIIRCIHERNDTQAQAGLPTSEAAPSRPTDGELSRLLLEAYAHIQHFVPLRHSKWSETQDIQKRLLGASQRLKPAQG